MEHTLDFLREQNVEERLIRDVELFRKSYAVETEEEKRVTEPDMFFYGKEVLEMAIAALLEGENLLLTGAKATGKNVLAENLAWIFHRPVYNVSFHVNTNSGDLIGTDTFLDNEVQLRKGSIYRCAQYGGFGILDEINMAKNDAVSVLHASLDYRRCIDVPGQLRKGSIYRCAQYGGFGILDEINMAKNDAVSVLHASLDYRRCIDVPGYDKIDMHPAARFIGTMNYGYAGTKELNEALVSRFLVIDMPQQDEETLQFIFRSKFPGMKEGALKQWIGLFLDLQLKAQNGEITTKAVDLRGILGAQKAIRRGLKPALAVKMGVVNKSFDVFEKEIVQDVVMTRIPKTWTAADVFED